MVVMRGHAFIQNLRRGHYKLWVGARPGLNLVENSPSLSSSTA